MEEFGLNCHGTTAVLEAEQIKLKKVAAKNVQTYHSIQGSLKSIIYAEAKANQQVPNEDAVDTIDDIADIDDDSSSTSSEVTVIANEDVLDKEELVDYEDEKSEEIDEKIMQTFLSLVSQGKVHKDILKTIHDLNDKLEEAKKVSDDVQQKLIALDTALKDIKREIANIKQYLKIDNLLLHNFQLPDGYIHMSSLQFSLFIAQQINFLLPELAVPLSWVHISTAHPLKTKRKGANVIVVRFSNRNMRDEIFAKKNFITKWGCAITEHLTEDNLDILKKARSLFGFNNVCTENCNIFVNVNGVPKYVKSLEHVNELFESIHAVDPRDVNNNTHRQHRAYNNVPFGRKSFKGNSRRGYSVRNRHY